MKIRIHHFLDIIRDFGKGEPILPNQVYQHSYHAVADILRNSPDLQMKIVVSTDAVCDHCIHNRKGECDDPLDSKQGFNMKRDYNDWLDRRILDIIGLSEGEIITPREICLCVKGYVDQIYHIYNLDTKEATDARKIAFIGGLKYYSHQNHFNIPYILEYH